MRVRELGVEIEVPRDLFDFLQNEKNWDKLNLIHLHKRDSEIEPPFEFKENNKLITTRWIGSLSFQKDLASKPFYIKIEPRVGENIFKFLLQMALGITLLKTPSPQGEDENYFTDILSLAWFGSYQLSYNRHGFPKDYHRHLNPHSNVLIGRFDISTHLHENLIAQHRIACEYFELTYNHYINQSIIQTVDYLVKNKIWPFNNISSRECSKLMYDKDRLISLGVILPQELIHWQNIKWGRHNESYNPTLHLSTALLNRNRGLKHSQGYQFNFSYFLDSAEIWELFLYKRLDFISRTMDVDGLVIESHRLIKNNSDVIMKYKGHFIRGLIPDYILKKGDEVVGIIDAKYKDLRGGYYPGIPKSDDIAQMALYQTHLFGNNQKSIPGVLIYPHCKGLNGNINLEFGQYAESRIEVIDRPFLRWWMIKLPEVDNFIDFQEEVDSQLKMVLLWFIKQNI